MMSSSVPFDIGVLSFILLLALLIVTFTGWMSAFVSRLVIFVAVGVAVYLLSANPPQWLLIESHVIYIYFGLLTLFVFLAARLMVAEQFQITPLDYLVIMIALIIGFVPDSSLGAEGLVWMAIQIIILFYACELIIQNMEKRLNGLTGSAMLGLALIALRGVI